MKIGVISDTHGNLEGWEKIMDLFQDVDMILHAGDILNHGPANPIPSGYAPKGMIESINSCKIPILIAKGNCDSEVDELLLNIPILSPYVIFQDGGFRILVQHGHTHDEAGRIELAKKGKVDLVISGHTHLPEIKKGEGVILLNPGSSGISFYNNGIPTAGLLIDQKVQIIDINSKEIIMEERLWS
ncbi:MAG: phosphodiesterase [bacterium]|nr:phosphodiesterase [bacterium]